MSARRWPAPPPLSRAAARAARARLDRLTKPRGSLGRLEEIALRCAAMRGTAKLAPFTKVICTFAADHGVAAEGVSAYPAAVTAQMVSNFLRGGAAINVLARQVGAELRVIDIGVDHDFSGSPGLIGAKIARGTANFARGPAMSRLQAETALATGVALAERLAADGFDLIGAGDMGIGNTTASSAITALLTGASVERATGVGTGIDAAALARKRRVIAAALARRRPDPNDAVEVLRQIGGFEIGGIAGLILGAAARRVPVVLDGFVATAGALLADRLDRSVRGYLFAAHRSAEPGHAIALEALGLRPLLALGLRLGEGTGAALGMGLIDAALRIYHEMATFSEAGVSERAE